MAYNLAYIHFQLSINPILQSNLYYKKPLKYIKNTNFSHTNSECKKNKNVFIPPLSIFPTQTTESGKVC